MSRSLFALPALVLSLTYTPNPPTSLLASRTGRIVNPHASQSSGETYTATITSNRGKDTSSSNHIRQLSDEEILARFTRGYFGGVVFWPEKIILTTLKLWKMAPAPSLDATDKHASDIWESGELPKSTILPRKSTVYGVFQVTDSYVRPATPSKDNHDDDEDDGGYSYIDFAFMTETFAGSHRFSIYRRRASSSSVSPLLRGDEVIELRCSSFQCDPSREGGSMVAKYLNWFHRVYAQLLIADGLRVV